MADERLIPSGILDESTIALNEIIDRMGTVDISPVLVYLIDNVNASALPHLAEQFHVMGNEGWKLASTEQQQRQLIKESIKLHKLKGTKAGVKRVLEALNLEGTIQEWFEYDGKPFHFRIDIVLKDRAYDVETFNNLKNMIDEYKNVRSILEEVNIESQFTMQSNCFSYTDAENETMIGE